MTRQEKKAKQEKTINKIMWLPICILLGIVPLIVRMVIINTSGAVLDVMNDTRVGDVYSNYKSTAIIMLCIIMVIIAFLCVQKENIKWDKFIKLYLIGGGIFVGISLIATLLSSNAHTAWWGLPEHAEGMVMNICYGVIIFYTLYIMKNEENYTYMILSLSFLVIMLTIIGAFQYFGYDLFMKVDFFKNMILGKEGIALGLDLTSDFEQGKVFGTMAHYNYMGSFGAMAVPFFAVLTLFVRSRKRKICLGLMTLCSLFLLFGSTSRAGFIGLVISMIMMVIIFIKPIIKGWKYTVPIIIGFIAVLFGFNAITKGTIFNRIPTLINESISLFSGSDESFNYLDHIPVRGVTYENGKQKIEIQEHTLYVGCEDGAMNFTDENGEKIVFEPQMGGSLDDIRIIYRTNDERFSRFSFKMEKVSGAEEGNAPVVFSLVEDGMSKFYFMEDPSRGVIMIDTCPVREEQIEFPKTMGFKGKEQLGSARGYIWSRSIPLMGRSALVGYGPDTYALVFPQKDYLAKWWAYGNPQLIVDKPHSLYLGIWINNGGLALVGFLIAIISYIVQSIKMYSFKDFYTYKEILGIASFVAVIGYLGAGIFNDSVVSVTPIFCILLGAGMGMNYIVSRAKEASRLY